MRDGRRLARHEAASPGDPSRPLSGEELVVKFHAFAEPVLTEAVASLVERTVLGLTVGSDNSSKLRELLLNRSAGSEFPYQHAAAAI
jgi:hypothetical protein